MPTILLHSSKTMRLHTASHPSFQQLPALQDDARRLNQHLRSLSRADLGQYMQISDKKAADVEQLINAWTGSPLAGLPAIDVFLGDIYSGLQVGSLTDTDRNYANDHLVILSGLYGALRALDIIEPYRLEMGYKIPIDDYKNLYDFWGTKIADTLPLNDVIINLSAVEYTKALLPFVSVPVITPKFLTMSPKNGHPTFVTVHTKIARGAFARWLITNRVASADALHSFDELGYRYDEELSLEEQPVFVCKMLKVSV